MKKIMLFSILTTFLFITGCSTTGPCTPKQHPEKYAFQALWIEIPAEQVKQSQPHQFSHDEIEALLKNPKAVLTEFPVVYAALGKTAVNDQTKKIPAHETYEVKADTNGIIKVVYIDGNVRVGRSAEIIIQKVEKNHATCALNLYANSLSGIQEFAVAPATETRKSITASLPLFKRKSMKTTMDIPFETWRPAGSIMQTNNGLPVLNLWTSRLIPPKGAKF
ncbi:MAG: hypothetical protein WCH86_04405 [Kiritimatiellales bacterium]